MLGKSTLGAQKRYQPIKSHIKESRWMNSGVFKGNRLYYMWIKRNHSGIGNEATFGTGPELARSNRQPVTTVNQLGIK